VCLPPARKLKGSPAAAALKRNPNNPISQQQYAYPPKRGGCAYTSDNKGTSGAGKPKPNRSKKEEEKKRKKREGGNRLLAEEGDISILVQRRTGHFLFPSKSPLLPHYLASWALQTTDHSHAFWTKRHCTSTPVTGSLHAHM